ncbi:hypothetical protein ACFYO2_28660 [Streptomyces sp. NPDC006602]|uniref:hypothetical protein n=1 Tax=Streptomyces sp. NPDC006602 TaxID=3364751 RepID=UPI003678FF05
MQYALDQQLDEDLAAYEHDLDTALRRDGTLPPGPAGSVHQVIDTVGRITMASDGFHRTPWASTASAGYRPSGGTVGDP